MPDRISWVTMGPLEEKMKTLGPEVDRKAVRLFFENCDLVFGSLYNQVKLGRMARTLGWNYETYHFAQVHLLLAYVWLN